MQPTVDILLDKITCPKQVRTLCNLESVDELANSLVQAGQLQPIRVRSEGDRFIVIIGGRRVAAARKAGFTTIAAIVEDEELSDVQILQRQFIENAQREDLTPLEKAEAIDQLMKKAGWSGVEVAAKLGLGSSAVVTRLLALLSLPSDIKDRVNAGTIPASAAYELSRISDPQKQAELASQLADGRLTRDGLAGLRKAAKRADHKTPNRAPGRVTAWLDADRSITLAGDAPASIDTLIAWLEELLAKARKARPQALSLPTFLKMLKDQRNRT